VVRDASRKREEVSTVLNPPRMREVHGKKLESPRFGRGDYSRLTFGKSCTIDQISKNSYH
jgi:hypothetical protein